MRRFYRMSLLAIALAAFMLAARPAGAKRFKGYPAANPSSEEPRRLPAVERTAALPRTGGESSTSPSRAGRPFDPMPSSMGREPARAELPGSRGPSGERLEPRRPESRDVEVPGSTERPSDEEDLPEGDGDAEESEEEAEEEEEEPNAGLLGTFLHGRGGLTGEYIYTGEVFSNMRGGIDTNDATRYLGLMDVVVTADLDEMGFAPGGIFFIYGQDIHGRGLTEDYVGDFAFLSNIDGPARTQLNEYWWQKTLIDDVLTLRMGKQDANAEFAVLDIAGDFINSDFAFAPMTPMPTYPFCSAGVVAFLTLSESLTMRGGIWDGVLDRNMAGFSGTGKTFSILEVETTWSLLDDRLPGDAHLGGWYHSDAFDEVTGTGTFAGNHGFYLGVEQLVLKESWDAEDEQGMGLFFQYGWSPEDRNEPAEYVGGGVAYRGLLPSRDDDVSGVAAGTLLFTSRQADRDDETVVELFHKVQLSRYIIVQPDLQYIASPSGLYRDAFVSGLRFEIVL